jgi:hypothetical protein
VGRNPKEWRRLAGHATEDHERPLDRTGSDERAMREKTVESNGDSEPCRVGHDEHAEDGVSRQSVQASHDDSDWPTKRRSEHGHQPIHPGVTREREGRAFSVERDKVCHYSFPEQGDFSD